MASKSKEQYAPLVQSPSDNDSFSEEGIALPSRSLRQRLHLVTIIPYICCVVLLVIIAVQSFYISHIEHLASTGLLTIESVSRVVNTHSAFDSEDEEVAAAAWEGIEAGHGDIAVDPVWAARQGLPPSYEHPFMPGKSVYIIEAYHAMHCLKVLRDHYMSMYAPTATSIHKHMIPLEHDVHCFDSLRQHIMCHADDTLMYSSGHHDAGVNQTKQCRDWDALRDWATERSAHWKDHINPSPDGEIWWGFDDGGDDGLPRGSLS